MVTGNPLPGPHGSRGGGRFSGPRLRLLLSEDFLQGRDQLFHHADIPHIARVDAVHTGLAVSVPKSVFPFR